MTKYTFPKYMATTMKLAAVYNILWGAWVVLFPNHFFDLVGMERLNQPMVWQGMGMVIGVYGLGYWWASYNPMRHWPIIAVGALGKLFGPLGFFNELCTGYCSIFIFLHIDYQRFHLVDTICPYSMEGS